MERIARSSSAIKNAYYEFILSAIKCFIKQLNRKYDAFWLVMKGNVSVKFGDDFLHV